LRERAISVEKIKGGKEKNYHLEITSKNDKTLYDDKNRELRFRWIGAGAFGEFKVQSEKLKDEENGEWKMKNDILKMNNGELGMGNENTNHNVSVGADLRVRPVPFVHSENVTPPISDNPDKTFIASIEADKNDRGGWFNWVNFAFLRKFLILWAVLTAGILVMRKTIKFKK